MTDAYRVLVTSSRTYTARAKLYAALDEAERRAWDLGYRLIIVIHGKAKGGDEMADDWALLPSPLPGMKRKPERHPVTRLQWYPDGKFNPAAGMNRNAAMVGLGAHECVAAVDECAKTDCGRKKPHGSHGATQCARLAERAGIKTRRIGFDGK
jgi:hypothetical protein